MSAPRQILLVDDNPADIRLVCEALAETAYQSRVHSVPDADSALDYLRRQGKYRSVARPDLVILDLNLVHRNGSKVLTTVKSRTELRQIPVVVFSSSTAREDVARSYALGANCYVSKPAELKRFFAAVRAVEEFWFGYVSLSKEEPADKENNERARHARIAD